MVKNTIKHREMLVKVKKRVAIFGVVKTLHLAVCDQISIPIFEIVLSGSTAYMCATATSDVDIHALLPSDHPIATNISVRRAYSSMMQQMISLSRNIQAPVSIVFEVI